MKKSIISLVISLIFLIALTVKISLSVNSLNIISFLVFGALLPILISAVAGSSIINLLEIKREKVKIGISALLALIYSIGYIFFLKFIDLDFNTIVENSQKLANNSSIQISNVSSQSTLTSGLINFFLVFAFIVIFTKISEKSGESYV